MVPIPPHLVEDFSTHLAVWAGVGDDGLVFPSTNPSLAFRTASQVNGNRELPGKPGYGWYHARQVAGCPDAHLHDLRHWGATLWDEAGTPTALRIAIMGHAQPGMTGHYTHPDTTKASPYAVKVSELAGWTPPSVAPVVATANAGLVPGLLSALDDAALIAALVRLDAGTLAAVVPHLAPERVALAIIALSGRTTT